MQSIGSMAGGFGATLFISPRDNKLVTTFSYAALVPVILCLGPVGSSCGSPKQVHTHGGVGGASTSHVAGVEPPRLM